MPLSSSPTLGPPPILPAKRDNEGADSPKLHTKRRGISTMHDLSLHSEKTFSSVSFLLRLFPDSLQMLVQTCSNLPTDQVGYICTCVTQTMEGSLETSSMWIYYINKTEFECSSRGTAVGWQRHFETVTQNYEEMVLRICLLLLYALAFYISVYVRAWVCVLQVFMHVCATQWDRGSSLSRAPCSDGC